MHVYTPQTPQKPCFHMVLELSLEAGPKLWTAGIPNHPFASEIHVFHRFYALLHPAGTAETTFSPGFGAPLESWPKLWFAGCPNHLSLQKSTFSTGFIHFYTPQAPQKPRFPPGFGVPLEAGPKLWTAGIPNHPFA